MNCLLTPFNGCGYGIFGIVNVMVRHPSIAQLDGSLADAYKAPLLELGPRLRHAFRRGSVTLSKVGQRLPKLVNLTICVCKCSTHTLVSVLVVLPCPSLLSLVCP